MPPPLSHRGNGRIITVDYPPLWDEGAVQRTDWSADNLKKPGFGFFPGIKEEKRLTMNDFAF
jgi:hypothetical protein